MTSPLLPAARTLATRYGICASGDVLRPAGRMRRPVPMSGFVR